MIQGFKKKLNKCFIERKSQTLRNHRDSVTDYGIQVVSLRFKHATAYFVRIMWWKYVATCLKSLAVCLNDLAAYFANMTYTFGETFKTCSSMFE